MAGRKPITACTDKEWRSIVERLRAVAPAPEGYRIVFRRSAKLDGYGDCSLKEKVFTIRILRGMSAGQTEEKCLHELAHALDWRPTHANYADHGPTWGCYYARIYSGYYGERH